MGKNKDKIIVYGVGLAILFLPSVILRIKTPSHREFEREKAIRAGFLETINGSKIEINLAWGNIFKPKYMHRDIGFDLVGVSCYFDPFTIQGEKILPTNPVLNSAVAESLSSKEEVTYLLNKIIESLQRSKDVVSRFMEGPQNKICEGDQIVPHCWNAYAKSNMTKEQGIKYLAALPLFNPDVLTETLSEKQTRSRLALNVEAVIRRLISFSTDELQSSVRSIGLPAIGSTSHKGGDSKYFLEFSEGFISILKGIETSRPSLSLDRIYLVGYDEHTGVFKETALNGLQKAFQYMYLKKMKGGNLSKVIGGILWLLYGVFGLLSYRNYMRILKQNNRWTFVSTLTGISALSVAISWAGAIYLSEVLAAGNGGVFIWTYIVLASVCLVAIRWMGKNWRLKLFNKTIS